MLLVDHDHAQVAAPPRTPPSGRRPPRAPRRSAMRRCSAPRRAGVSPLCSTATVSPKRAPNRPAVCGVSAISGTSTIAPRPCASARSITAQVDLGLARPGDAVQQHLALAARPAASQSRPRRPLRASVSVTDAARQTGVARPASARRFGGRGGITSASARASVEPCPRRSTRPARAATRGSRPVTSSASASAHRRSRRPSSSDSTTPSTWRAPSGTRTREPRTTSAASARARA